MNFFLKLVMPAFIALGIGAWLGVQQNRPYTSTPPALLSDITLPDISGETVNGKKWTGKVVVLNHWASWCPPCVKEIPLLMDFQSQYAGKGVQVVGIAHDTEEAARMFSDQMGINYPSLVIAAGGTELMISQGNLQGSALPFTAFFDREGKLISTQLGVVEMKDLIDSVTPLL